MNLFPLRKFTAVSFCKISLKVLSLRLLLGSLLFAVGCDVWLFLLLAISPQTSQWSVKSCAIDQSVTPFQGWWRVCLLQKSQLSVFSHLVAIPKINNNIVVCNRAGWDKNWTDFKRKGGLQAVYICRTMQPAGYVGTTKNLQILLNTPKNPYLNQTTQKILAKFSLPKKSQNQKFQYQTNSVIIPIT